MASKMQTLRHLAALEAKLNPPPVVDDGQALARLIQRYDEIALRRREAGCPELTGTAAAKVGREMADYIAGYGVRPSRPV